MGLDAECLLSDDGSERRRSLSLAVRRGTRHRGADLRSLAGAHKASGGPSGSRPSSLRTDTPETPRYPVTVTASYAAAGAPGDTVERLRAWAAEADGRTFTVDDTIAPVRWTATVDYAVDADSAPAAENVAVERYAAEAEGAGIGCAETVIAATGPLGCRRPAARTGPADPRWTRRPYGPGARPATPCRRPRAPTLRDRTAPVHRSATRRSPASADPGLQPCSGPHVAPTGTPLRRDVPSASSRVGLRRWSRSAQASS